MNGRFINIIKFLKKRYYQLRYWSNLYRNMVKQLDNQDNYNDKNIKLIPFIDKPGIAFSFDDSYRVNDWYMYGKDMFGFYDIKVTFNINGVHPLEGNREHNQKEIDQLLELQASGHEIAHHGYKHQRATDYSAKYGYDKWIEDEIETLFNWIEKQSHSITKEKFKKPVSFAFPHFKHNRHIINKIIPKYFKIARGHLSNDNLTDFNHVGFTPSICLDSYYSCNLYYLKKIMRMTKKTGKNLILTCHSILPEDLSAALGKGEKAMKWGTWRVSPKIIQTIIDEARKHDLEFYTTSEIAGIATFIDPNFEICVREKISNPSDKWVKISELLKIKELNLSNKDISNLDGLEYFLNLERINLSNNNISDLRLLKNLPKLIYINIENNPIESERVNVNHKGMIT